METKYLFGFIAAVFCLSQIPSGTSLPQGNSSPSAVQPIHSTQPESNTRIPESQPKSGGDAGYTHYTYRAPGAVGGGSSSYSNYPSSGYARDVYGHEARSGNPIFGVQSAADFQLSAYFGQIFWGFVAVILTLVVAIWIIKFFAGTDLVGGLVDKMRDSGATGKALDLDRITNMVYEAFDTYGKWAAKEARYAVDSNQKGR